MLLSEMQRLLNKQLAGEMLSLKECASYFDYTIDGINEKLGACYPTVSDIIETLSEYNYFPDKYIRSVVIPGAAWRYYVEDEEGLQTAVQYQVDYENGRFLMQRDMLYAVPVEYQVDVESGSVAGEPTNYAVGDRGLIIDGNDFAI